MLFSDDHPPSTTSTTNNNRWKNRVDQGWPATTKRGDDGGWQHHSSHVQHSLHRHGEWCCQIDQTQWSGSTGVRRNDCCWCLMFGVAWGYCSCFWFCSASLLLLLLLLLLLFLCFCFCFFFASSSSLPLRFLFFLLYRHDDLTVEMRTGELQAAIEEARRQAAASTVISEGRSEKDLTAGAYFADLTKGTLWSADPEHNELELTIPPVQSKTGTSHRGQ